MSDVNYDSPDVEIEGELNKIRQKQAVARYNQKVDELSEKIVHHSKIKTETSQQIVEVLLPFLEVAIEMQGVIEIVTSINEVVTLIGDAINLLDTTMKSSNDVLVGTTTVKYGFFQRIKQKIQIRRAKTNNQRRVMALTDSIVGHYELAMGMADQFKVIPEQMRATMARIRNKNAGKKKKKGAPAEPTKYELSDNLKRVLSDKGADLEGMGYGASGGAAAPASTGGSGSGDSGAGAGSLSDGL